MMCTSPHRGARTAPGQMGIKVGRLGGSVNGGARARARAAPPPRGSLMSAVNLFSRGGGTHMGRGATLAWPPGRRRR
jgi:hypothetical protein